MYSNINGKLVLVDENLVTASSRAIYYGDGCFETFVSYRGKFLHFDDHFERLQRGLEYLEITSPFNVEKLQAEIYRLIEKNELENDDTVVRVQCYREGGAGYFNISDKSSFIISTRPIVHKEAGVNLKSVSIRAIPTEALERKVKLSNSINYIKAAQEAKKNGGDDALMLTTNSKVSETTIANIFWLKDDQVYTPSQNCDLLPGVTRAIVIKLINEHSELSIREDEFILKDIFEADSVFCCNSVKEIQVVSMVDHYSYDTNHSVLQSLVDQFQEYKSLHLK